MEYKFNFVIYVKFFWKIIYYWVFNWIKKIKIIKSSGRSSWEW